MPELFGNLPVTGVHPDPMNGKLIHDLGKMYHIKIIPGHVADNTDACPGSYGTNNGCDLDPAILSDENYVHTRTFQTPMADDTEIKENRDVIESVTYFDGLGRPMQRNDIRLSPDGKDVIAHIGYDAFGRQDRDWLPYMEPMGDIGSYRGDVPLKTRQYYQAQYGNDFTGMAVGEVNPYSQKLFEASPLNRVLKQAAPGKAWALGNGNEISFDFDSNGPSEVRRYDVTLSFADNTYTPTLSPNGHYGANELYKTITRDENHPGTSTKLHTTEEFVDKQGRTVLKRTYADGPVSGAEPHDTYYVYDDYGNLTYVIPPKVETADGISGTELDELCYQYKYDHRNRLVEKKIPGRGSAADWEEIVYNRLDRPILTRDPNLKAQGKWLFTKYDAFGRVVYTGVVSGGTRLSHQTAANAMTTSWAVRAVTATTIGGTPVFYDNGGYPASGIGELHTVNYYDTYVDADLLTVPQTVLGQAISDNVKGLPTVSKVRVLDPLAGPGPGDWITTISGYDQKGRVIYTASKNGYLGTTDIVETDLDFVGRPERIRSTHQRTGKSDIVTLDSFTYDHAGRLLSQVQCIGDGTLGGTCPIGDGELIVYNGYDELGQLAQKKVGGTPGTDYETTSGLQTVDYGYNVRGWLTNINDVTVADPDKLFNFNIGYNQGANPLYNGNISQTQWRTANTDSSLKTYDYAYDAMNRIVGAVDNTGNYNLSNVTYDKNGNILTLKRQGHVNSGATSFGAMDILDYDYDNGNKLTKVTDTGNATYGFKDGTNTNDDFEYDTNGNLTQDLNKGIAAGGIEYNHLNLPFKITVNSSEHNGTVDFIYGANGKKQKKILSTGTTKDYAGNYIYSNGKLQFFSHPEGYVIPKDPDDYSQGFDYIYQYKDQLGNVRLSYQDINNDGSVDSSEILHERNYYPFGLEHRGYNGNIQGVENNHFTYQGQELTKDLGLIWHSFKWRNHDPAIARFFNIDPLAEKFPHNGPYNFSENRVVDGIELEGLEVLLIGKYTTGSAGISVYGGGGVVVAPDGVYGFGEYGVGFETNVSISSEIGVTFYPTMPAAKYAAGDGYSLGVNANVGLIANGTASINAVESSGYLGLTTTFGVGAGLPGVVASISGYKSNTTLKPISDLANKSVALDALNSAKSNLQGTYGELASERNSLIKQQNHLRETSREIVGGLESISNPEDRSAKLRELKANLDALDSSKASMNNLNENINNVQNQIDQINQVIDNLQ